MATEIEDLKAQIKKLEKKLKDEELDSETEFAKVTEKCEKMMKESIANKDETIRDLKECNSRLNDLQNALKKQNDDFKSGILADAEKIRLEYRDLCYLDPIESIRSSGAAVVAPLFAVSLIPPVGLLLGFAVLVHFVHKGITHRISEKDKKKLEDKYHKDFIARYPNIQFPSFY